MLNKSKKEILPEKLKELQEFILPTKSVEEGPISQVVKLRLKRFSYREMEKAGKMLKMRFSKLS